MLFNLLAEETPNNNTTMLYIILGVLVVLALVYMLFSGRKGKQRQKEYIEQLEALAPGHKVKTIGGICGIVMEVCDDNTVVICSGTEASGKSFLKIDKECIAQTDAKGPTQISREEAEAKRKAEKDAKNANHAPEFITPEAAESAPEKEAPAEDAPAENDHE